MAVTMLRAKDAAGLLGIGVSTFWRWVREGRLPRGISLTARCTVWKLEDIEAFISSAESSASGAGARHER